MDRNVEIFNRKILNLKSFGSDRVDKFINEINTESTK